MVLGACRLLELGCLPMNGGQSELALYIGTALPVSLFEPRLR